MGVYRFATLYFISGIGGILFSALCSDTLSVGASTAVYGLIGAYVSYLVLNWIDLKRDTDKRWRIMVFLVMALVLSILVSASTNIDVLGHLGGFIFGAISGMFLVPKTKN